MVAQSLQVILAAGLGSARRVRGAHIGGEEAKDIPQSHLVLDHLVLALSGSDSAKVLVTPGVAGNLVALGIHPLDDGIPTVGGIVDLTLAVVVASDEESGLGVVLLQHIKHAVGVDIGTIVVSKGDLAVDDAVVDTSATVGNGALEIAGNAGSVSSSGGLVGIAGRTIVEETIRRRAVVSTGTTPSLISGQMKRILNGNCV